MNRVFFLILLIISACSKKKEEVPDSVVLSKFPDEFNQVLNLHGELDHWKYYHYMRFVTKNETHTIDLWSRHTKIESENYSLGFDGKSVWIKQDSTYFTGSPVFYHNLYFYFQAMPFVLADPGTHHEIMEPVSFQGKSYNGIKVTFDSGVGAAPKDEYILYYDPETKQMQWLAYMSTFFSKAKKNQYNLIRYEDWHQVRDIWLAGKLTWYSYTDGVLGEPRNSVEFKNVMLSEKEFENFNFDRPESAQVIPVE